MSAINDIISKRGNSENIKCLVAFCATTVIVAAVLK
jgi:hypothetical protein